MAFSYFESVENSIHTFASNFTQVYEHATNIEIDKHAYIDSRAYFFAASLPFNDSDKILLEARYLRFD